MATKETVRQFLLKKYPPAKYEDCPVPESTWELMEEFANQECEAKDKRRT